MLSCVEPENFFITSVYAYVVDFINRKPSF